MLKICKVLTDERVVPKVGSKEAHNFIEIDLPCGSQFDLIIMEGTGRGGHHGDQGILRYTLVPPRFTEQIFGIYHHAAKHFSGALCTVNSSSCSSNNCHPHHYDVVHFFVFFLIGIDLWCS